MGGSSGTPSESSLSLALTEEDDAIPLAHRGQPDRLHPSPDTDARIRRKFDKHIMIPVFVLYMLSSVDRGNLGNARIAGMEESLQLYGTRYDQALEMFYISYIIFQWCTLFYKVFRPHRYIAICVFSWGLFASMQSIIRNYTQLATLRFFLGMAEAAFGGVPFYLSFFYRPEELGLRVGIFICAAPLAATFSSSLAYALTSLSTPLAPWRLLLLAEGFPTCIAAVVVWFIIPDSPSSASFLTAKEQHYASLRTHHESGGLRIRDVFRSICDYKTWLIACMYFATNVSFASLPPYLPSLINAMGFSALAAQGLSAPPYAVAFGVVLAVSCFSDRVRQRGYFVMVAAAVGCLGYLLQLTESIAVRYIGMYFAASGMFSVITILIPWTINNARTESGRGGALALINFVGQFGPLLGTRLYPKDDGPRYVRGLSICAGFLAADVIISAVLRWRLAIENRRGAKWML